MTWSRRGLLASAATVAAAVAGCREGPLQSSTPTPPTGTAPSTPPAGASHTYTHLQASGNRVLDGSGRIDRSGPVEIPIEGTPAWLLAHSGAMGTRWTVVTAAGTAATYRIGRTSAALRVDHGDVSTPPIGYASDDEVSVLEAPAECENTHPVPLDDGLLYVASDGDLVFWRASGTTRLDIDAPADARLVAVGDGRYACYGGAVDWYNHGALGDTIEGSTLLVVDAAAERVETETALDEPTVFEGLSPLVADLDGDGTDEIVTTVANAADGARIRVYGIDGTELATGPVYGPGWRHQLCVAPFTADGSQELAVVRKPHVDRTVEFYRFADGGMTVSATQPGFSSHSYGSRNLDQALAADLDGDGRIELLVPTRARTELGAIRRTNDGTTVPWSLDLDGSLTTNVTGAVGGDGEIAVGAGTATGVRIWRE